MSEFSKKSALQACDNNLTKPMRCGVMRRDTHHTLQTYPGPAGVHPEVVQGRGVEPRVDGRRRVLREDQNQHRLALLQFGAQPLHRVLGAARRGRRLVGRTTIPPGWKVLPVEKPAMSAMAQVTARVTSVLVKIRGLPSNPSLSPPEYYHSAFI